MAFKSKTVANIGTSSSKTTISDTVAASTTHVIMQLSIANTTTANRQISVTVTKNGGSETYLIENANVGERSSMIVIGADQRLVLEAGDILRCWCSASSSADAVLSYYIGT